ncbi:MAG TPA: carboxypeptidase-like regulatory domain-containing protein [Candidatus Limnocylindrales bacterium]|jgi:hypothetical protein
MGRSRGGPLERSRLIAAWACVAFLVGACTIVGGPVASLIMDSGLASAGPGAPPSGSLPTGPARSLVAESLRPTANLAKTGAVVGHLTSGPTCPVDTVPPNPACAPRPVTGATVVATNAAGRALGRTTSDGAGYYVLKLAPGAYILTAEPFAGLMGSPRPVRVDVPADGLTVDFHYDTGIR